MSAMVDFPKSAIPHRKPLPSGAAPPPPPPAAQKQPSHSHSRTASSNVFPAMSTSSAYPSGPAVEQYIQPTRRTLSNATTSTSSSGDRPTHNFAPVRTPSALRRSGSGRTTTTTASVQPTSYVALMRKQKATVWSERAQHEDPRLLAAQRAAKMRAAMEVVGGPMGHRSAGAPSGSAAGSGGLRSKIRHHGATKATTYSGANMARAGVPMRLSANEVDEGDSEEELAGSAYHRRTGSGRSSLGSDRRATGMSSQFLAAPGRDSRHNSTTPPSGSGISPSNVPQHEDEASARPHHQQAGQNYFEQNNTLSKTNTGLTHNTSSSSGGSRENSFGQLAPMAEKKAEEREQAGKRTATHDDLIRRGSVDERSMTMTGVRLFVANPDVDD